MFIHIYIAFCIVCICKASLCIRGYLSTLVHLLVLKCASNIIVDSCQATNIMISQHLSTQRVMVSQGGRGEGGGNQ